MAVENFVSGYRYATTQDVRGILGYPGDGVLEYKVYPGPHFLQCIGRQVLGGKDHVIFEGGTYYSEPFYVLLEEARDAFSLSN